MPGRTYNGGKGDDLRKALDSIYDYTKTLITLATGTIAISATFLGKDFSHGHATRWLIASWITLLASIVVGIVGIGRYTVNTRESEIRPRHSLVETLGLIQVLALLAGLALLVYFATQNIQLSAEGAFHRVQGFGSSGRAEAGDRFAKWLTVQADALPPDSAICMIWVCGPMPCCPSPAPPELHRAARPNSRPGWAPSAWRRWAARICSPNASARGPRSPPSGHRRGCHRSGDPGKPPAEGAAGGGVPNSGDPVLVEVSPKIPTTPGSRLPRPQKTHGQNGIIRHSAARLLT